MTLEGIALCRKLRAQLVGVVQLAVVNYDVPFAPESANHRLFAVLSVNNDKPAVNKRRVSVDENSVFVGTSSDERFRHIGQHLKVIRKVRKFVRNSCNSAHSILSYLLYLTLYKNPAAQSISITLPSSGTLSPSCGCCEMLENTGTLTSKALSRTKVKPVVSKP